MTTRRQRGPARSLERRRAQIPFFLHQAKDQVSPRHRASRIPARRVDRWAFGERSQERSLGDGQVLHPLAKQVTRRALDAVHTVAEVNRIDVQLEDFILGKRVLHQARETELEELAAEAAASRRAIGDERVPRYLHRDRRKAFTEPQRRHVSHNRASDATPVESVMFVEAPIFGGNEGPPDM